MDWWQWIGGNGLEQEGLAVGKAENLCEFANSLNYFLRFESRRRTVEWWDQDIVSKFDIIFKNSVN